MNNYKEDMEILSQLYNGNYLSDSEVVRARDIISALTLNLKDREVLDNFMQDFGRFMIK